MVDLSARNVLADCRPKFPFLTEIKEGTCTVTAFPGDDLQLAADRLPDSGGELCLAAGTYRLDTPVTITKKTRVVITGIGPATVLTSQSRECVVLFQNCTDVTVRDLRAESGTASKPQAPAGEKHLLGTISLLDCTNVTVRDCEVSCPDSLGRAQSSIFAGTYTRGRNSGQVRVLDNKIAVGAQQTGVLIVSAVEATVAGNEIRIGPPTPTTTPSDTSTPGLHPLIVDEVARFVASHVVADDAAAGHTINLAGGASMRVAGASVVQRLAGQFGKVVTEKSLSNSSPRKELQRFTRRAMRAPESLQLSREVSRFLVGTVTARSLSQGIVIGGMSAGLVRIQNNLVTDAIQGIHVGLSGVGGATASAGQVVISGNVVACAVPFFWGRARHAYYVGSVKSLTMTENSASLFRTGGAPSLLIAVSGTPVEAVRVYGRLGYLVRVQGMDLTGPFAAGVVITDLSPPIDNPRLFYVSDVINAAGTGPALLPNTIPHDRCTP